MSKTKTAVKVTRTRASGPVRTKTLYTLTDIARPKAGNALFAHTQAALDTLGMGRGATVNRAAVVSLMGPRAVSYHLSQKNFAAKGDGIALTKTGIKNLKEREVESGIVAAFRKLFTSGKADKSLGVSAKQIAGVSVAL